MRMKKFRWPRIHLIKGKHILLVRITKNKSPEKEIQLLLNIILKMKVAGRPTAALTYNSGRIGKENFKKCVEVRTLKNTL